MIRTIRFIIIWGLVTSACGTVKRGAIPWEVQPKVEKVSPPVPVAASVTTTGTSTAKLSKDDKKVKGLLDDAYKDWKGIPYVLGGTGYNGVDCSSFMQIVFDDYFGISLPRNTKEQLKVGKSVKKKNIDLGDLVFFKTGRNTLHVGVMVNTQDFMHASTSSGVMISRLDEKYWADRYLSTRRIR